MKHIKSFEDFVNEDNSINEAKWEVLGSMGNFQVFPDKEKGDHVILILGKGGDQREYPVYLKKRDTADKLRDRYYQGRLINIKESAVDEELNEASIINRVIITNKLFHKDSNFWVKNKFKFVNMINKFMKDSSIGDNDEMILVTLMERDDNWSKLDESIDEDNIIVKESVNEMYDEYDTSSISRSNLISFLNYLNDEDISYSMERDTIEFDVTELDKKGQKMVAKLFESA